MVSIAIVGSGPSGCYTAQALLKALPDARIDILDRLPVPYGLIRYGVAPDHQGTKAVIRQFERLFERQGVGFFGNVALGQDITLDALREAYDAVVLATGLSGDRRLGIEGEDLPGVIGSGALTRVLNDHPEGPDPGIGIGREVVIIGNGNVAIDLLRLMVKQPGEFEGSDLSVASLERLTAAGPRKITIIGRSPAAVAKFDPVMLREMGRLESARISVIGAEGEGKLVEALVALDGHAPPGARHEITFRFGWTPERVLGEGRVEGIEFRATEGSPDRLTLPCDTLITAIGFQAAPGALAVTEAEDGAVAPGIYAVGWVRRGPRGTIPENRADAQAVAARIAADLTGRAEARPGRAALARLCPQAIPYDGWQRIDAAERAACPPDRARVKIDSLARMHQIAFQTGDPL